jgi:ribonuclease Z
VIENKPDDYPIRAAGLASSPERDMPLGPLRSVVIVTAGQKIGYVTDVADTAANQRAIVDLVRNADVAVHRGCIRGS